MALITYADKQAMGSQPTIPDVNKINDTDMNEIKTAINNRSTYTSSETVIGVYNNKPLYRNILTYTNITSGSSSKDITSLNIDEMRHVEVKATHGTNTDFGNYYGGSSDYFRMFYRDLSGTQTLQIRIASSESFNLEVTLEYTKTS